MGSLKVPEIGKKGSTEAPKVDEAVEALNAILGSENKVKGAGIEEGTIEAKRLETGLGRIKWYTPKVIATEQTRESASFGTLTTADEIKEVVLPENGLIEVGYVALVKSSVAGAGRAAIFLGSNQLKNAGATTPSVQEASTNAEVAGFQMFTTTGNGMYNPAGGTSFVTTGQSLGVTSSIGGLCYIYAAAGTYNISVQYKATSGSITAKERKMWCSVRG